MRALDGCATPGYRAQLKAATTAPDWQQLTKQPATVFVVVPGETQDAMAPLVAMIDELRRAVFDHWRSLGLPKLTGNLTGVGGTWLLALDELANIAPLPGLPSLLSEGASQGVVVCAALQDLSQARWRYPKTAPGMLPCSVRR